MVPSAESYDLYQKFGVPYKLNKEDLSVYLVRVQGVDVVANLADWVDSFVPLRKQGSRHCVYYCEEFFVEELGLDEVDITEELSNSCFG